MTGKISAQLGIKCESYRLEGGVEKGGKNLRTVLNFQEGEVGGSI